MHRELVERAASITNSSVLRADPDTAPRWSPNTHDTSVSCSLRQIGHITELGLPWYFAARSRYGLASQTSETPVRPEYTSASRDRRLSA